MASRNIPLLIFVGFTVTWGCEHGWQRFSNKCYMFSHTTANWMDAESTCRGFRSKLAEPMTRDESTFLATHTQLLQSNFWIGISDLIEEDRWIYSSNLKPITFNDWYPGEPNQHLISNCIALWHGWQGKWVDEGCAKNYNFICELPNTNDGAEIIG